MKIGQLKAGVILSYFSQSLQILITLFYTPVMLGLMQQGDYGLYQIVYSTVSMLSLMTFGFSGSYMRFYASSEASCSPKEEIARLNGTFMLIFTFLGFLVLALGLLMAYNTDVVLGGKMTEEELATARILMYIMVVNCALHFPAIVYQNYIIANERFILLQTINVISIVLNPCLTFPLLLMGKGSIGLCTALLLITIIKLAISIIYCKKKLHIKISYKKFRWRLFKDIGSFSFYIFIESIVSTINISLDRFLLGKMVGSVAAALYAVGGQINTLYTSLSTTISSVFVPRINRLVEEGNNIKAINDLYVRVGKMQFVVLYLVLLVFGFFGQRFMTLWAGNDYSSSYYVAIILIIPNTINLIQNVAYEVQRAMGLQKYRSLMLIGIAIINIVVSIYFIQLYGECGAALGTAVAWFVGSGFVMNWFYWKYVNLDIWRFWREIMLLAKGGILPLIAGSLLYEYFLNCSLEMYIFGFAFFTLVYLVSMFCFGFNSNQRKNLISTVKTTIIR